MLHFRTCGFAIFVVFERAACSVRRERRLRARGRNARPANRTTAIFRSSSPRGVTSGLQINRVMDILGIAPGKSVADIGAGSGWFTVRAADAGRGGTGVCGGYQSRGDSYIDDRAQKEQLQNVKTILSKPDDPQLPAGSVDAVLMLKTYHEIAQPVTLLRNLRAALRPGAKVGVIDRNGNGEDHGVGRDVVIREAKEAGYKLVEQYDFVKGDKMDYFLVFTAEP